MPHCSTKIALVVSVSWMTVIFKNQIRRLTEAGFSVVVICSPGPEMSEMEGEGALVVPVCIEREIAPLKDLKTLWTLWRSFRRLRPDVVNVGSPKGGLLGGLAARLAGVPHRVYTLHGLRLETTRGPKRWLLWLMEWVACGNVQHVRCVSESLRLEVLRLRLAKPKRTYVVGKGSANGIDIERFQRDPKRIAEAQEIRRALAIPQDAPVIGFVGRFTRDKGISELYGAFEALKPALPALRLLLVGDFEEGDPVGRDIQQKIKSHPDITVTGMVPEPAPYYAVMDVFALPTYREGLGTVSLEAQAAGVPVVTTRVTGVVDSVLDGLTGLLVPAGDKDALAAALRELLENSKYRRRMGSMGANWVAERYNQEIVGSALIDDYNRILGRLMDLHTVQPEEEGAAKGAAGNV